MADAKKTVKQVMNHAKSTKNKEMYAAPSGSDAEVENLYIIKGKLGEPRPDVIEVTITAK